MANIGTVYLVGAGPGDPGLITVKGLDALRRADVVVYDRLAPAELLANAREDAELISAAKAPGTVALTQTEINELLVERALFGQNVCRLKGGDPFVFGRGGEEAIALAEAGVPFIVIPGITSAIGAAAYAGIPVTHRGIASSVTVVTGSEFEKSRKSGVDWQAIAKINGTIVILMGASRMGEIASELIACGRSPSEPTAAVHRGTSSNQQTVVGTLSDIDSKVKVAGLGAPIAMIVGDVVNLREEITWFDTRPLFGKRVLVTRARSQASRLASGLAELGATVVECPAIRSVAVGTHGRPRCFATRLGSARVGGVRQPERRQPGIPAVECAWNGRSSVLRLQNRRSWTRNGRCVGTARHRRRSDARHVHGRRSRRQVSVCGRGTKVGFGIQI